MRCLLSMGSHCIHPAWLLRPGLTAAASLGLSLTVSVSGQPTAALPAALLGGSSVAQRMRRGPCIYMPYTVVNAGACTPLASRAVFAACSASSAALACSGVKNAIDSVKVLA